MKVKIAPNKLNPEEQFIDFADQKIYSLIGANGAGKSSILESIFENYLESDELNIICFSSGQNELYTGIFNRYKSISKRYLREENPKINSYYFHYDWVRILVYFASILKPDGNVRQYLRSKNYINEDPITKDDITSRFLIRFRIKKSYSVKISREISSEASVESVNLEKLLRKSDYHLVLESIISSFNINFDFSDEYFLLRRWITFDARKTFEIFTHKDINRIFTFWALASHGYESNIDIEESILYFKNDLEFNQLSDGEYQLLSIYALIDLFDSDKTIFLFDEIDSHLYFKNIGKLWELLKNRISGKVITTTHLSESILRNEYNGIKYVENGKIENSLKLKELAIRMSQVVGINKYEFQLVKRIRFVVLIDDEVDWLIFKKLAFKKIGLETNDLFEKMIPFKRNSSYNSPTEIFGKSKLHFIREFKNQNTDVQKETKKFLLICDKDSLSCNQIGNDCKVQIHPDFRDVRSFDGIETILFSWRRMEIENYLLSYTMLEAKGKLDELRAQFPLINFVRGHTMDGISDIAEYDSKLLLHPLYKSGGFSEQQLDELINLIPADEISSDIATMYNSLKLEIL